MSAQLALVCLESMFRLSVFGGHDLYTLDAALAAAGFMFSPLTVLSKVRHIAVYVSHSVGECLSSLISLFITWLKVI